MGIISVIINSLIYIFTVITTVMLLLIVKMLCILLESLVLQQCIDYQHSWYESEATSGSQVGQVLFLLYCVSFLCRMGQIVLAQCTGVWILWLVCNTPDAFQDEGILRGAKWKFPLTICGPLPRSRSWGCRDETQLSLPVLQKPTV